MKIRTRFFLLTLSLCLLFSLLCCSAVSVSALSDSITEITSDGWVNYKKLNLIQFTYKVNGSQNEGYVTKNVNDLSLPYGPRYFMLDDELISEFWITVSLQDIDLETNISEIAVIKPGEAIALNAGLKLWLASGTDQSSFAPIGNTSYGCRIYLDDDYTRYIEPTIQTSTQDGSRLYWSFTNNTDKDIVLSRITFGIFEDEGNIYDAYGYGYAIRALQYRIFSDEQLATQAITDSIQDQTDQITDSIEDQTDKITGSIEDQTEEHRNMFERLGDRISGFFDNLLTGIIDGLKSLFIPESTYFTEYFDQWDTWMTDHFGALYYPFDLMLDVLNRFVTLEVPNTPMITFPSIQVFVPGQGRVTLTEAVEFDIMNAFYGGNGRFVSFKTLYESYKVIVTVIFVFGLANLARKKLNSIMGGGE